MLTATTLSQTKVVSFTHNYSSVTKPWLIGIGLPCPRSNRSAGLNLSHKYTHYVQVWSPPALEGSSVSCVWRIGKKYLSHCMIAYCACRLWILGKPTHIFFVTCQADFGPASSLSSYPLFLSSDTRYLSVVAFSSSSSLFLPKHATKGRCLLTGIRF